MVGFLSTPFTIAAIPTWYARLRKPLLTPPSWVFGPVWITLYMMMGIALYFILEAKVTKNSLKTKRVSVWLFGIQLGLNFFWSFIFFFLQQKMLAVVEILLFNFVLVSLVVICKKVSNTAAYLLTPYYLWVLFATYLSMGIWALNS